MSSTSTPALSAPAKSEPFQTITVDRRDLRDDDVLIDIRYAGICHSDIHEVRDEWGGATFPMVPGHEIAGEVARVGSAVTRYSVGDRVGVGCMVDSCGECEFCKDGEEQYCDKGAVMTYAGTGYDGEKTQGGYSQQIVVSERFVLRIPDEIGLDVAAPLLCAGITTYNPLKRWGAGPGKKVAVIGLGGLGHMAVKLAAALGAEVSVLSRTRDKEADGRAYGATAYLATADVSTLRDNTSSFDLIINTVSANLPIDDYLALLRPTGALVNVGLPTERYDITPGSLVMGSRALTGSNIGGIAQTQEMLDFCGAHGIGAEVETISADQVGEAYDRVVDSDVRYRFVIDTSSIGR